VTSYRQRPNSAQLTIADRSGMPRGITHVPENRSPSSDCRIPPFSGPHDNSVVGSRARSIARPRLISPSGQPCSVCAGGRPARSRLYCHPRPLLSPQDTSVSCTIAVFVGDSLRGEGGTRSDWLATRPLRNLPPSNTLSLDRTGNAAHGARSQQKGK